MKSHGADKAKGAEAQLNICKILMDSGNIAEELDVRNASPPLDHWYIT